MTKISPVKDLLHIHLHIFICNAAFMEERNIDKNKDHDQDFIKKELVMVISSIRSPHAHWLKHPLPMCATKHDLHSACLGAGFISNLLRCSSTRSPSKYGKRSLLLQVAEEVGRAKGGGKQNASRNRRGPSRGRRKTYGGDSC